MSNRRGSFYDKHIFNFVQNYLRDTVRYWQCRAIPDIFAELFFHYLYSPQDKYVKNIMCVSSKYIGMQMFSRCRDHIEFTINNVLRGSLFSASLSKSKYNFKFYLFLELLSLRC